MTQGVKIFFYTFLVIMAISGLLFYLNPVSFIQTPYQNAHTLKEWMTDRSPECPNYLKKDGTSILLYDLNQPASNTNPLIFASLAEYQNYAQSLNSEGIQCPVLELQPEFLDSQVVNNAIPPGPILSSQDRNEMPVNNVKFNQGDYPVLDGENHLAKFEDDPVPEPGVLSDNPMDPNWGGPKHSAQSLASGKYEGDYVGKPLYFNMHPGTTELNAGMPGFEVPPPNYVPRDLIGDGIQMQHSKNL